ncbi:hypothetical protein IE53DRAFT_387627 [Violaceomyces palustris]|uniref:Uncharacterized protein n=1 Tax=Violaceomyces palustris TaxID=1673888 RepID=A0ACD0NW89_9BASI|nr:hypothetical protein IE53DRAFT_387627 [Violaceomyces palustris]
MTPHPPSPVIFTTFLFPFNLSLTPPPSPSFPRSAWSDPAPPFSAESTTSLFSSLPPSSFPPIRFFSTHSRSSQKKNLILVQGPLSPPWLAAK